jgi:predicted dehydrogenase
MNSRRDFLQKITASALAFTVFPRYGQAITAPFMKQSYTGPVLRVAIMGLGSYGTRVAEAMQSCTKARLVGVISGTPAKISHWRQQYALPEKNCYNYENFDAIKNNPDIDAVYVITPNALHRSQVIRVAQAGKHVICEKPMAVTVQQAQEMIAACKKAGVQLLIGYRMHFEPQTLEVIRMRQAGAFGNIQFFQGACGFTMGNANQWRLNKALSGGGALMDIGIYAVNGARYMVGEEPVWVTAQETKTDHVKFKEGIDETIQFQLGFNNGAIASCLSTYSMNHLDRFFLTGQKGFAEMYPATNYGPIKGRTHLGELQQPIVVHQALQMEEMAAIILEGKQPVIPVNGEEGMKDLAIIAAIYEAARSGKRVDVNIPQ